MKFRVRVMGFQLDVDFGIVYSSKQALPVAVEAVDPWEEDARRRLRDITEISTPELGIFVLGVAPEKQDWHFVRRVGGLMHKLGYELVIKKDEASGFTVRRWVKEK